MEGLPQPSTSIVLVDKPKPEEKSKSPWTPTSTTKYTECHSGTVRIFSSRKGINLYGGGTSHGVSSENIDIIFDLADGFKSTSTQWNLPSGWKAKLADPPVVIDMHVRDGDPPTYRADANFWKQLWQDLVGEVTKRNRNINVLVACQGGHGRTGTVLSCLIMAAGVTAAKDDPITWLRDRYCKRAVESQDQIDYIEYIWDLDLSLVQKAPLGYTSSYVSQAPSHSLSAFGD